MEPGPPVGHVTDHRYLNDFNQILNAFMARLNNYKTKVSFGIKIHTFEGLLMKIRGGFL